MAKLKAQTAIEYLLVLTAVAVVVFLGFRTFLPRSHDAAKDYFDDVGSVIVGDSDEINFSDDGDDIPPPPPPPPPDDPVCGDNVCEQPQEDCNNCPADCPCSGPFCGDQQCNNFERCFTCEVDCGPCVGVCPAKTFHWGPGCEGVAPEVSVPTSNVRVFNTNPDYNGSLTLNCVGENRWEIFNANHCHAKD